jgi:hypothetical protein
MLGASWNTHLPGVHYAAGFAGRSEECLGGKMEVRDCKEYPKGKLKQFRPYINAQKIRNPNIEIRDKSKIRMLKCSKAYPSRFLVVWFWSFEF